ncbi:MAG: hypothetical protein H0W09_08335 [Solirubrobacterales bacterium]|nr:hypothetical protein [Solirubrobacterales bacterium]
MRIGGLLFLIYIVVGLLVAAGIIGGEGNFFSGLSNLEEVIELILAILLWPLILLGVSLDIGNVATDSGGDGGGGGGNSGGGGGGGN